MKKVKVLLADLRHIRNGVLFADTMPLGIGYMKAVIDRDLFEEADCEIFAYADAFKASLLSERPDIVMVTNYMWNEALSLWYLKFAKEINPNTLTIMGGPNISLEEERQKKFITDNPQIDIYALGEGDYLARDFVKLFISHDGNVGKLKSNERLPSAVYICNGAARVNPIIPRTRDLDDIPSPWLTGIMDKFFDGKLTPLYESNRGCPFTCTFCVQGTKFYTKVTHFGLDRVREEIHYIAQKIDAYSPNVKILRFADPNFGMYERDVEIARFMGETQKKYRYPTFIDATTGKNKHERIIQAMEEVSGALIMWQSLQSINETVLDNVKRKNIKLETYDQINVYLQARGLRSQADLILCLPGETLMSHIDALRKLTNAGVDRFNNFQAMMLKGSEMETLETRNHFGFKTKIRLIQKNFSTHNNEIILEPEEIIIATDTFSFDEYIVARKYHLMINLFLNELRFEKLLNFFDVLKIPRWNWIEEMFQLLDLNDFTKKISDNFASDTKFELFDSIEALQEFYKKEEHYKRLESGEIGDNVIHKYRLIVNYYNWTEICDFAFNAAYNTICKNSDIVAKNGFDEFWRDFKQYQIHSSAHGITKEEILSDSQAQFTYDIRNWIFNNNDYDFERYKLNNNITYRFCLQGENKTNLESSLNRWSTDFVSMTLLIRKIKENWLEKEAIQVQGDKLIMAI